MDVGRYKKILRRSVVESTKLLAGIKYRRDMQSFRALTESEIWAYQRKQFLITYRDAIKHVPYYGDRPQVYSLGIESSGSIANILETLPILPKDEVRRNIEQFWRVPPLFGTMHHSTGGSSTGTPLPIQASLSERGHTNALLEDRFLHLVGKRRPREIRVTGFVDRRTSRGKIFWRIPATNIAYMSVYELKVESRQEIVKFFQRFKPEVLHGYASAIHQLALLMQDDQSRHVLGDNLVVITTAETLTSEQRMDISSILRARVYDEYGSQEGQHFVMQCNAGSMHIHPARGIVELLALDDDRPVEPGELGRVVVTGLASRSMPLIRYDIGDSAVSTGFKAKCECGLQWPTIGAIQGRIEEMFVTRDGRRISMLANATMKDVSGVIKWQAIQCDYEKFIYRVVDKGDIEQRARVEAHVRSELQNRLNVKVDVRFEYIDDIPRTVSGKHKPVIVAFEGERRIIR